MPCGRKFVLFLLTSISEKIIFTEIFSMLFNGDVASQSYDHNILKPNLTQGPQSEIGKWLPNPYQTYPLPLPRQKTKATTTIFVNLTYLKSPKVKQARRLPNPYQISPHSLHPKNQSYNHNILKLFTISFPTNQRHEELNISDYYLFFCDIKAISFTDVVIKVH